jgi:hypothetical protein
MASRFPAGMLRCVLVYAHRGGTPEHERIGAWLKTTLNGDAPFGLFANICTKL